MAFNAKPQRRQAAKKGCDRVLSVGLDVRKRLLATDRSGTFPLRRCVEIPVVPDRASLVLPDWRGYNDGRLPGSAIVRLSDCV